MGNYPAIPTQFDGNTGFAIPAFNVLNIIGNTSQGVSVAGDGASTLTITVADATTASKGVAQFDAADFSVVGGVVSLNGGGGGAVLSVSGTANRITSTGGANPVIDIAGTYVGQTSITTLGTITTGTWNGSVIPLAYGGTNANLTANNGGIFYSTATEGAILAGTATAGQHLQSGATAAPSWTTATYPSTATATGTILRANGTNWVATTATYPTTTTVSQILYSSSADVVSGLPTANNSILSTSATGVPSLGTSLTNDYTFTSSAAGGTRTLTVTNTDNTNTSSKAIILASTGGASSGDALFQASTTTTTWSFGVDNSVTSPTADPFVISQGTALGTNNIMSVATSGEINFPLQPSFLATGSSQTNATGDGTNYTLLFATEIYDSNGDYSSPTFTAPVTGHYDLGAQIEVDGLAAGNTTGSAVIVTSNRNFAFSAANYAAMRNSGNVYNLSGNVIADMDAADTASVTCAVSGGTKIVGFALNGGARFWGNLQE